MKKESSIEINSVLVNLVKIWSKNIKKIFKTWLTGLEPARSKSIGFLNQHGYQFHHNHYYLSTWTRTRTKRVTVVCASFTPWRVCTIYLIILKEVCNSFLFKFT